MTPVIQFTELRQLVAEIRGYDEVRVTAVRQIQTTQSSMLTQEEVQIGVAVRLLSGLGHIKAWYHEVDILTFYQHNPPNGQSPEQERLNRAWEKAQDLKAAIVAYLQTIAEEIKADLGGLGVGCAIHTDGLIDIGNVTLLHGTHHLVLLPDRPVYITNPTNKENHNGHHH